MGLLDRLFGKKGAEAAEEESLVSHQERYDHHAPIDLNGWSQEEEPLLDLELAAQSLHSDSVDDGVVAEDRSPAEKKPVCKTSEGEVLPLILTVMAKENDHFEGGDLLREFNAAGLHIGKDGLFHLYPEQGEKAPLFSVSNVLNPGLFDPKTIMSLQTRGLVLFIQLPAAHAGKDCFTTLVETANRLAMGLNGEIRDGERRLLNNHTLQRMQEQVLEFDYCRELERRKAEQQDRNW